MKIFIVSTNGDSLDLAKKLYLEDHDVSIYIKNKKIELPDKIITVTTNPTLTLSKADMVLIEDDKSGEMSDKAKKLNKIVIGGNVVSDRLVSDPKFGTKVLLGCNLPLASERAIGTNIEVGGWFVRGEFLKPYFMAFKYHRFGGGEIGPELGPMGIVGTYKLKGKIFREFLLKTESFLKSTGYTGYAGLDLLVNDSVPLVMGWQIGFKFPTINLLSEIHPNFGKFLWKVATGTAKITSVQPDKTGTGVTYLDLAWLYEHPQRHRPQIVCEGGSNIDESRSKVFKTIRKLLDPMLYYRSDIGDHSKDELKRLMANGWL